MLTKKKGAQQRLISTWIFKASTYNQQRYKEQYQRIKLSQLNRRASLLLIMVRIIFCEQISILGVKWTKFKWHLGGEKVYVILIDKDDNFVIK